jgi:hypothetical protein
MPGGDGTGPMGAGSMTGRGQGYCTGTSTAGYGTGFGRRLGFACRRGFGFGFGRGFGRGLGRFFVAGQDSPETQKELLRERKDFLKKQLVSV